ncbi:MAG: sulfatase-like hydrolase/transferase [Bryobacteraceae bacterium]|nr:sulfatase-like hydrolase/transferase [Bryobacteraceae bacterium]
MLNRRHFLMGAGSALAASARGGTKRNVLFIASDDLNHCFSTYAHPLVRTPNLDAIARNGVRFDRSYCQFPLCSPSRTSIMTGLAPDATGVYDLRKHFRESVPNVTTLGQAFRKNDYFVARVGKIYHYGNPGGIGTNGLDDEPTWERRINPAGIDKKEEPKLTNFTPNRGIGSAICFYASPAKDEEHTDGMVAAGIVKMMEERRGDLGIALQNPVHRIPARHHAEDVAHHNSRPTNHRFTAAYGGLDLDSIHHRSQHIPDPLLSYHESHFTRSGKRCHPQ